MLISVSLLSAYLYCKRKLFLEKVLGLYEGPKEAPIKGTVRHMVYEEINNAEERLVTSITKKHTFDDMLSLYTNAYSMIIRRVLEQQKYTLKSVKISKLKVFREIWPIFQQEAKLRARNISNFIQKHNIFGNELWENLTPKIKSELKIISENLNLIGKIDQLEIHKEMIIPVELKTGSSPTEGIWPSHRVQVAAYALLLEEQYSQKVNQGSVFYLDQNIRRTLVINPFMKEEVIELRKEVEALLSSKQPPEFAENQNKCSKCGLKEHCHNEEFIQARLQEMKQNI